jgi:hypothetical protein
MLLPLLLVGSLMTTPPLAGGEGRRWWKQQSQQRGGPSSDPLTPRSCPHNLALQGGLAGQSMVLERSGSRLFGVTPFANDTITLTLSSQPAVRLTFAASQTQQPATRPSQQVHYWPWEAQLPPLGYGGSLNLSVWSAKGMIAGCPVAVITDVTVGQIFLCSGQSNSEYACNPLPQMIWADTGP